MREPLYPYPLIYVLHTRMMSSNDSSSPQHNTAPPRMATSVPIACSLAGGYEASGRHAVLPQPKRLGVALPQRSDETISDENEPECCFMCSCNLAPSELTLVNVCCAMLLCRPCLAKAPVCPRPDCLTQMRLGL